MTLDDKARDTFEIITRAFDQVESDLEGAHTRGEMNEREFTMQLSILLKERLLTLCEKVPGFREDFETVLQSKEGVAITEAIKGETSTRKVS